MGTRAPHAQSQAARPVILSPTPRSSTSGGGLAAHLCHLHIKDDNGPCAREKGGHLSLLPDSGLRDSRSQMTCLRLPPVTVHTPKTDLQGPPGGGVTRHTTLAQAHSELVASEQFISDWASPAALTEPVEEGTPRRRCVGTRALPGTPGDTTLGLTPGWLPGRLRSQLQGTPSSLSRATRKQASRQQP